MKKLGILALALGLSACASLPQGEPEFCEATQSYLRGQRDAQQGNPASTAFTGLCSEENISSALKQYREGYGAARSAQRQKSLAAIEELEANRTLQSVPAAPAWVCEVEASAKVFTGVGGSLEEATRSAKDTCGAHFQSSSCTQTECKQNL